MIVGCGALSELHYSHAISALPVDERVKVAVLVDPDAEQLNKVGRLFPNAIQFSSLDEVDFSAFGAAIVASPQRFHAEQTLKLLRHGIHVLCEKPMASSLKEARAMVDAATQAERHLAVGMFRRFFPSTKVIKELVAGGALGKPVAFEWSEGGPFNWPAVSPSFFLKATSSGGVLADLGVHVLDLLLHWFGEVANIDYQDDAMGGLEANARLSLTFAQGVRGTVRLSRDTIIANGARIDFERGHVYFHGAGAASVVIQLKGCTDVLKGELHHAPQSGAGVSAWAGVGGPSASYAQSFMTQIQNFCRAVRGEEALRVPGGDALPGMALIEQCYANRSLMPMPWLCEKKGARGTAHAYASGMPVITPPVNHQMEPQASAQDACGLAVAVLGANGFVGSRLVEMFHLRGTHEVVPVVRGVSSLARLSRFNLRWRLADARHQESLAAALEGCDTLVDCTVGNPSDIEAAARALLPAAKQAGVRRVVYLSSASVHGQNPAPGSDENSPLSDRQEMSYNNAKVRAERRLFADAARLGVELFVLRPSIVFGPRDRWIVNLVQELEQGRAWLVEKGNGICNTIYVDNLVHAIQCCLDAPSSAAGRAYLVGDEEVVTWADLYRYVAKALGRNYSDVHQISVPAEPVISWRDRVCGLRVLPVSQKLIALVPARIKEVAKGAIRGLSRVEPVTAWRLPEERPLEPSREIVLLQQCRHRFPHVPAEQALGYHPQISFAEGMDRTIEWIRWTRS